MMKKELAEYTLGEKFLFFLAFSCGFSLAGVHIAIGLSIAFLLYFFATNYRDLKPSSSILKWYLILLLCWLFYVVTAQEIKHSFRIFSYFALSLMPIFFAYFFVNAEKTLQKLLLVASFSCTINAFIIIYEVLFAGAHRSGGNMDILNYGILAGLVVTSLTILLFRNFHKYSIKLRCLIFFILAVNILGIICNSTRAIMLGLLVSFVISLIAFLRVLSKKHLVIFTFILFIVGAIFINTSSRIFFTIERTRSNYSIASRIIWWEYAIDTFKKHPIFGVGTANFPVPDIDRKTFEVISRPAETKRVYSQTVHSSYLQILATMGIFGFLSYFSFWFNATIRPMCKAIVKNKTWGYVMLANFIFFFSCAFTDFILLKYNMYMFTFFVGISLKGIILSSGKENKW